MKKVLLVLMICTSVIFSQDETLLGRGRISHGGYGGPVVKFMSLKNEFGVLIGGKGAWVINHSFGLGGGGYGLANNIKTDILINGEKRRIQFGYGGAYIEYVSNPHRLVHISTSLLIGGGAAIISDGEYIDHHDELDKADVFFALEPELSIEVNITTFFRVNFGASYLFVSGLSDYELKDEDFRSPGAFIGFKFGSF